MRIQHLDPSAREDLLRDLLKRSPDQYGAYEAQVAQILEEVREKGDEALFAYTERFDGAKLSGETVLVTEEEIREAYQKVPEQLVAVIRRALKNIEDYHAKQKQYSWFDSKPDGTILGQKVTPLKRVGVYVPGGKAAYPSSVLMNILPAKVAGVEEILMVTPPGKDGKVTPTTLVAAHEAGATAIYKAGGAQAVAALAYGTESIPKVDKIVGPGNIYVALAKKAVYGHVSIDAPARNWRKRYPGKWISSLRYCPGRRSSGNPWIITAISWWRTPWMRRWRSPMRSRRNTWRSRPVTPMMS